MVKKLLIDNPTVSNVVFYPRKILMPKETDPNIRILKLNIENDILIGGFFYLNNPDLPTILLFHGNGEIASDYDFIAPHYTSKLNLCIVEYRGYGLSTGSPSFSAMLTDAHKIFTGVKDFLNENGFTGPLILMGRSLGSASAIELASSYQDDIAALIIESGFAHTYNLLYRLGIPKRLFMEHEEDDVSPLPLMKRISLPTLIIHGKRDFIIPVNDAYSLHNACSSERKKLIIIPPAGHNDIMNYPVYMDSIFEFLTSERIR